MYRHQRKLLSTSQCKKLKKTIQQALGREKERPRPSSQMEMRSSSSVKSLGDKHIHVPFTALNRTNSRKSLCSQTTITKRPSLTDLKPQKIHQLHTKTQLISIQKWWHSLNHQLQSQRKIKQILKQSKKQKVTFQYFASHDPESKQQKLILALQNDFLYSAESSFQIYAFDRKEKQFQHFKSSIKADKNKYSMIIVLKTKNEVGNLSLRISKEQQVEDFLQSIQEKLYFYLLLNIQSSFRDPLMQFRLKMKNKLLFK